MCCCCVLLLCDVVCCCVVWLLLFVVICCCGLCWCGFWFGPTCARPLSTGPPKISQFFSLSRRHFVLFLSLSGVFSLNFGGDQDAEICTFGLSGCHVKPRRIQLQTCTIEGSSASKHHKIPREDPQERETKRFGPPTLRASHPSESHFFWVWALTLQAPPPSWPHPPEPLHDTHRSNDGLGKNGLPRNGLMDWPIMVLAKIGLFRWGAPDRGRLMSDYSDRNRPHTCPTKEMCATMVATEL